MSAPKELNVTKLGIIAGGGALPKKLSDLCKNKSIPFCIAGIKNQTDSVKPDQEFRIGQASQIIKFFKAENVSDIVFIGAVTKPSFFTLWPDWQTFKFFVRAWIKSLGDDGLLKAARVELEKDGFSVRGIHQFLPDLLLPTGVLGASKPKNKINNDIELGLIESQKLGVEDIGQAVIVKDGKLIAREDKRGTNVMIKKYGEAGAILVKTCKPQQDRDLDLPTLGLKTVEACVKQNMAGIVGHAENTLFVDQHHAIKCADENKIFIMGAVIND